MNYTFLSELLREDLGSRLHGCGFISSDMNHKQAAAESLNMSFLKKLAPDGNSIAADRNALVLFKQLNESPRILDHAKMPYLHSIILDHLIGELNDVVSDVFDDTVFERIGSKIAFGPGASVEMDSASLYNKMSGHISTTSTDLVRLFERCTGGSLSAFYRAEMARRRTFSYSLVRGSNLFFAKKNAAISRTCCTEPGLNMLIQQGIGSCIEDCLAKWKISLSTQPDSNRMLACLGSIDDTYCTIDLKSASDTMWYENIKHIFRHSKKLLWLLDIARSPSVILPDGSRIIPNMISTMGNGFTFPLQTLIFAATVRAVSLVKTGKLPRVWGVFGDDIIVEKQIYHTTVDFLHTLGFIVNNDKSYSHGHFRESCGTDWFHGRNIRGVYIRSLEQPHEKFSAVNRLTRWSAKHGIPLFRTIGFLLETIGRNPNHIPCYEDDSSGLKVPSRCTNLRRSGSYRGASYTKLTYDCGFLSLRMADDGSQDFRISGGRRTRARKSPLPLIPEVFELCFLAGHLRSSTRPGSWRISYSPKILPGRWKTRKCFTPNWDFPGRFMDNETFESWKTLMDLYLDRD